MDKIYYLISMNHLWISETVIYINESELFSTFACHTTVFNGTNHALFKAILCKKDIDKKIFLLNFTFYMMSWTLVYL